MLYSLNNQYPTDLPHRIRLSNGLTRTNPNTFTTQEIADAGYVAISIPEYNPELEQLVWTGAEFLVELIPPPPPQPNWDSFNQQMLSDSEFNQVYNQANSIAPIVCASLPAALTQVANNQLSMFTIVWNQIMSLGQATEQMRLKWKNWAEDNNLPTDFVNIIGGIE